MAVFGAIPIQGQEQSQIVPTIPEEREESVGVLQLVDMDSTQVLAMLESFTGKPILRQQNLPEVKINLDSQGPMSKSEAILVLESLLSLNGIAITSVGEKFLKAVPAATIGTQVPPMLGDTSLNKKTSQKIYSKFYKLDYLTPEELIPLIQPMLSQGAPVSFSKSNSILVTDALINLQRIEDILQKVDRPAEMDVKMLFYQLTHVAAKDIISRLQSMQTGSLKRFLENNTSFEADERTNQLIIFTHPSNIELINDLIERLDIDVAPATATEIFYLKHADATEVTNLIEQVITGQQRARKESKQPTTQGNLSETPPSQSSTASGSAKTSLVADLGSRNLQFSDFLNIVADPRGNSILASGTPNDLTYLKEIIDKIDILLAQVRIEVVIAEVTLEKNQARGIESFGVSISGNNEIGLAPGIPGLGFSAVATTNNTLPAPITLKDFTINAVLETARSNNLVEVLSSPTIVTTHNQEATISVGESRPVITASQSSFNNVTSSSNSLRSTVQFRDIGIELTVKPLIGSNGIIQMEIDQKVESVTGSITVDSNEQPIIGSRKATSFVSVADGELVVLGGMQELNSTDNSGRLAFFGSIPVVGPLFGSKDKQSTKRELIIFIKPKIIRTTKEANQDTLENLSNISNRDNIDNYIESGAFLIEGKRKRMPPYRKTSPRHARP